MSPPTPILATTLASTSSLPPSTSSSQSPSPLSSASPPSLSSTHLPHPPHNPLHVLLLLDVQHGMLSPPPLGVPSSKSVHENIALILHEARTASPPPLIIHVRNTGDQGEPDEPNTPGWHLAFQPKPGEYVIDKLKNNAFAGTSLGEIVRPDAEMVVVGMQSDFCVRATCSAALGRGNEVLLIKGAHATYDRIEVWYGGRITPASRVEVEVENELEEAGVIVLDMKDVSGIFNGR
ncbi:hypothetical protein ONZ45_g17300 [Pleurotus djamor]|nr:hypothetical protein ONZ45_g17300 [Pleurotus djamor]